jgi:hypothetical protein
MGATWEGAGAGDLFPSRPAYLADRVIQLGERRWGPGFLRPGSPGWAASQARSRMA